MVEAQRSRTRAPLPSRYGCMYVSPRVEICISRCVFFGLAHERKKTSVPACSDWHRKTVCVQREGLGLVSRYVCVRKGETQGGNSRRRQKPSLRPKKRTCAAVNSLLGLPRVSSHDPWVLLYCCCMRGRSLGGLLY